MKTKRTPPAYSAVQSTSMLWCEVSTPCGWSPGVAALAMPATHQTSNRPHRAKGWRRTGMERRVDHMRQSIAPCPRVTVLPQWWQPCGEASGMQGNAEQVKPSKRLGARLVDWRVHTTPSRRQEHAQDRARPARAAAPVQLGEDRAQPRGPPAAHGRGRGAGFHLERD